MIAAAVGVLIPRDQVVPVPADQQLVALMAIGTLACGIVDVDLLHLAPESGLWFSFSISPRTAGS